MDFVYILLANYADGVDCRSDVVAVYAVEAEAELAAVEWNRVKGWVSDDGMGEKWYSVKRERLL